MKRKKLIINPFFDYKEISINRSIGSENDEIESIKEEKNDKKKK